MSLTIEELILLNKYVQGVVTQESIYDWFCSFKEEDKRLAIKSVWYLAIQAQATENDIENAAKAAGLRMTHTPVVILLGGKEPFKNKGYKLSSLEGVVLYQAFKIVLECFVLAEQRRKLKESSQFCHHWWHKDLSDELVVKEILKNNT